MKKEVKIDSLVWLIIITFAINIIIFPPHEAYAATGEVSADVTFGLKIEGVAESYFTECTGVGSENEIVEYKTIDEYGKETIQKIPGRLAWNEIVLKRALTGNKDIWTWRRQVEDGQIANARKNISVVMYVNNRETAKWNLQNAWPYRISASLNADGIMEEEIGLVYEKPVREVVVASNTVTFDKNGGDTEANPTTKTAGSNESIGTLPTAPTRTGYTFAGWNTAANGSGTAFTAEMAVTSDIIIYAQWMEDKTINASASSGGSISPGGSVSVTTGGSQTFTITPGSGHRIKAVTVDGISQGAVTTYTFTNITANHAIYASFTDINAIPATPVYNADVSAGNGSDSTLPVTVDENSSSAVVAIGSGSSLISGKETTVITVPVVPDVESYTLNIAASALSTHDIQGSLIFNTEVCKVTIPSNMLTSITGISGRKASISMGQVDKSNLSDELKTTIGNRPLVQFNLSIDGKQTEWNNPDAPVTVSIPYTPTAEELRNPENIIIWYIDGSGNAISIPDGHYDYDAGAVIFTTTHFSYYAVGYNKVSFNDVAASSWYNKAVNYMSARGITTGTGKGNFSPDAKLTRGDFLVMLMKSCNAAPDTKMSDNFTDAGNTYYTGYLAAAKRLGISSGAGNNLFLPEKEITRQEMFTLLYNALKVIGKLPQGNSGKELSDFTDAGLVDSWAKDAVSLLVKTGTISGNAGMLAPASTTTRAEMAQVLYNLSAK